VDQVDFHIKQGVMVLFGAPLVLLDILAYIVKNAMLDITKQNFPM
jgi:hypothetical protein